MQDMIQKASKLLRDYKKDSYSFGIGCLGDTGRYASQFGKDALLVISSAGWAKGLRISIDKALKRYGISCKKILDTPAPDTPVRDVAAMSEALRDTDPQVIICVGGGSAIDCAKAANIGASLGTKDLGPYLGQGKVKEALDRDSKALYPMVAVQTNSGSGSHLSKNAVVTYTDICQKKLISDQSIVPDRAVFDYSVTKSMARELTIDGALDGFSHSLEIYYGLGDDRLAQDVCLTSIAMIVDRLPLLLEDLQNLEYRKAIALATDLGGYALMLGNTSGAHLNSFSMVDIASHGRACAILNPYYTVFYAPAISAKLGKLAHIFEGFISLEGDLVPRMLGEEVARGIISFYKSIGFPTTLGQLEGFNDAAIAKALKAAKDPQLEMKLKSMPVPLAPGIIDRYMGSVLSSAKTGDLSIIENL